MPIQFTKFHGYGNDYIVIESDQLAGAANLGEFARRICDRNYGAGSDGIAVVSRSAGDLADFGVRIFNPDGSEAGLSGNGTRCAAAWLYYSEIWNADELRLNTRSGVKRYFLRDRLGAGRYLFDSELGQPRFDSASIPMLTDEPRDRVMGYPLVVENATFAVTAVQLGNPNCCLFVEDFDAIDWRRIGRDIERHRQFPDRTNVVFVRVWNRQQIELRIWERGVGETTASGTCSCAAAVASMINDLTDRDIVVVMPGGHVKIQWRDDDEVILTGTAEIIYRGEWLRDWV
jgi:diaminopimelate epimerase